MTSAEMFIVLFQMFDKYSIRMIRFETCCYISLPEIWAMNTYNSFVTVSEYKMVILRKI